MLKRGFESVAKWYMSFGVDFASLVNDCQESTVSFLDICCGYGKLIEELARSPRMHGITKDIKAHGIDMGWSSEHFAQLGLPGEQAASVLQGDATDLPFPDESFDVTNMMAGMAYIDNGLQALFEQYRVTRVGGVGLVYIQKDSTDISLDESVSNICSSINEHFGQNIFEIYGFTSEAQAVWSSKRKPYYLDSKLIYFKRRPIRIQDFHFTFLGSESVPDTEKQGHEFEKHWRAGQYAFDGV